MNIHTAKGGQNLTELAHTLYKVGSARTPESKTKLVEALRAANPQLTKDQAIPAGTMIMVPDLPGHEYRPFANPGQELAAAAASQLRDVLGQVGEALATAVQDKVKSDRETVQQLEKMTKDTVVLAPGKKIADRLKSIRSATKQRAKTYDDQRTELAQGIAGLGKDLATFLKMHER
jgi:phage tail protein X